MGKYVINLHEDKKCHFVLKSGNGEIVLTSQTYASKKSAVNGIASVAKNAPLAEIEDQTKGDTKKPNPKFEVYEDKGGKFRFRLLAKNGQNIGHSEAYENMKSLKNGINSIKKNAASKTETAE